uniref:Uncharacterized protein n=1 Tax=Moniliophthora roreri TaxID=221103 RepID=A0A0W0F6W0_MONRR
MAIAFASMSYPEDPDSFKF